MAETSVVPVDAQGLRGPFAATVRGRSLQCKRQAAVLPALASAPASPRRQSIASRGRASIQRPCKCLTKLQTGFSDIFA